MSAAPLPFRHVAVEGPIGVGKTSLVQLLAERFDTPVGVMGGPPRTLDGHLHQQNLELIAWIRGRAEVFRAWRMR